MKGEPDLLRMAYLDVWRALGGTTESFVEWARSDERRQWSDAWRQLMAAVRGDIAGLLADTNPPAGDLLLELVKAR